MGLYLGNNRVKIRTAPYVKYVNKNNVSIVDGIASGFMEGNTNNAKCLILPETFPIAANSHIHFEFTPTQLNFGSLLGRTGSNVSSIRIIAEYGNNVVLELFQGATRLIRQSFAYSSALVLNNRHSIDLLYDGSKYTITMKDLDADVEKVNATYDYTMPSGIGNCGFTIGATKSDIWYVYLKASVDLNNSYIKVNGQYWWRGDMQNVETYSIRTNPFVRYTVVGTPTITDGVASGFSSSNCLDLTDNFAPGNNPWEMIVKAKVDESYTNSQYIIGDINSSTNRTLVFGVNENRYPRFWISSNGTSWNVVSGLNASQQITRGSTYYFRCGFSGTQYYIDFSTDRTNYVGRATSNSSTAVNSGPIRLGQAYASSYYWRGTIDLKESYIKINGQYWWCGNIQYQI